MKIILTQDVGGVGKKGDVKDVSDGYGLNLLIPKGLARQATKDALAAHQAQQKKSTELRAKEEEALAGIIRDLSGERIEMRVRATEKGGLFKSIGAEEIANALLAQKRVRIPHGAIKLASPIKTVGEHPIKIEAAGAASELKLAITPET